MRAKEMPGHIIADIEEIHKRKRVVDPRAELLPVMLPTGVEAEDKVPGKYIRHTITAARDTTPHLLRR